MDSVKKVTKAYNNIPVSEILAQPYNNYTCVACKKITKTVDLCGGTTSMGITCEFCEQSALSSFYVDSIPEEKAMLEWYRPTLKQTLKLRKNPSMLEHVLKGGLLKRYVTEEEEDLECSACGESLEGESETYRDYELCTNCMNE